MRRVVKLGSVLLMVLLIATMVAAAVQREDKCDLGNAARGAHIDTRADEVVAARSAECARREQGGGCLARDRVIVRRMHGERDPAVIRSSACNPNVDRNGRRAAVLAATSIRDGG